MPKYGNYAVLNPLDKSPSITNADGNLSISTSSSASHNLSRATIAIPSSGKFYVEVTFGNTMTGNPAAAFALLAPNAGVTSHPVSAGNYCVYGSANTTLNSGATTGATVTGMTTGQIWTFAVDVDAGNAWIGLNNTWFNSYTSGSTTGNPSTGANPTFSGISLSGMFFGVDLVNTSAIINFGQRPFAYTPPSGYNALNTYNLSTPSIVDGSKQFAASLYTGTGSSLSVSGANFTPDFVWIKSRSAATNHKLTDVVRGVTKALVSNSTAAETTDTNGLTAFNSNGFTVGTDTVYNNSGATYVGWQWKAGGTAVTNTAGSITSSVSANTTAGFSVVTYTGNGTASTQTIGHGLGTTLSMLILKGRASSGDMNWGVSHTSIAAPNYLLLNSTGQADNYGPGQGQPSIGTGNTFKVLLGTTGTTNYNTNGATYVAYCFAAIPGYSAFGSYTGNGSADGAFIYTGFLPRLILVKCSSTTGNWFMLDTARNTYNVIGEQLEPNLSNAGSTVTTLDVLSNGFKMRTSSDPNASQTYVYAAFAANPFKNSLAF